MKKTALLLCFIMLFSGNVFAASTNSLSGEGGAYKEYTGLGSIKLNIRPLDEVTTGSSIILTFETAKVFSQEVIDGTSSNADEIGYNSSGYQYSYLDWDTSQGFYDVMPSLSTNQLPYKLRRINDQQIEVQLINLPGTYANGSLYDVNGVNNEPYYCIPMTVYTYGSGDVRVTIDSNSTSISGGYVKSVASSGPRTTTSAASTTTEATTSSSEVTTSSDSSSDASTEATTQAVLSNKVYATVGSNMLTVNGSEYEVDAAPFVQESTSSTLIPLRAVTLSLTGKTDESGVVSWDADTKTATVTYGGSIIKFTAGSEYMTVNGKSEKMANGAYAEIRNSRMFVPFRALGEALGADVEWDAETKTAIFN